MIAQQVRQSGRTLPAPWRPALLTIVVSAAAGLGALAAHQPTLALAAVVAALLALAILARPDAATLVVLGILYSNAAVVAVRFHGVPTFVGAAVPGLLTLPLASHLLFNRRRIVVTPALPLVFVLLAVEVIGMVFSRDRGVALSSLLTFLVEGIGLYFLITNLVRTPTMLRHATWVLILTGALVGALSIYQDFTHTYGNNYGGFAQMSDALFDTGVETIQGAVQQPRLAGPLGDTNRYAQIMVMLIPLALFQFLDRSLGLARVLAAAAAGFIAFGVALTFSRGAAVGFGLVILIMAAMRYIKPWQLALVAIALLLLFQVVPEYRTRLTTLEDTQGLVSGNAGQADGAVQSRLTENLSALNVFLDHPLIGVGPGLFPAYYREYADNVGLRVLNADRQAHNLYLGLAAEAGILGLGCFFGILFVTFRRLARERQRLLERRPDLANLLTGYLLAIVSYLTTGIFLHFSYIRYFWMMLALANAAGAIAAAAGDERPAAAGDERPRPAATPWR